jgi:hypothetical protein
MAINPESSKAAESSTYRSRARAAAVFVTKVLFATSAFGLAGISTVNYAFGRADEWKRSAKHDADQLMLDAKVLACSTGNQLIINFNDVSVDPLKQEAAGINKNTGTIAQSMIDTQGVSTTTRDVDPSTTQQTIAVPAESPPTSALLPEGSSRELSSPCPTPSTTTISSPPVSMAPSADQQASGNRSLQPTTVPSQP